MRLANEADRRATFVRLTRKGLRRFAAMAEAHERLGQRDPRRLQRRAERGHGRPARCPAGGTRTGGRSRMTMQSFKPQHFNWRLGRRRRGHLAGAARAQEPAHLRVLRRAARHLPRPPRRRRREGGRHRLQRRQLLLGRRRARHHRPAARQGHEGPARLHAHDRRPGQGHEGRAAAGHRRGRRRVRRRRRDDCALRRHAPRHARRQDRVPVHPRRPRRLRHGRLRHAAPRDRPGPRRRAALHGPHHVGGGGRALGLLQPAGGAGRAGGRGGGDGQAPRRGPDLRAHDDQDHAQPGMVDDASTRPSRPRPRRRPSACRPATSAAPTTRSSPRASRSLRGIDSFPCHSACGAR